MHVSTRLAVLSLSFAVAAPLSAQMIAPSAAPSTTPSIVVPSAPSLDSAAFAAPAATPTAAPAVDARSDAVAPSVEMGAPLTGLRAGAHRSESTQLGQPSFAANHAGMGQPVAMMVVGLAGLVAGAIIGGTPGTIVMVAGAAVGLYGLYQYVQ